MSSEKILITAGGTIETPKKRDRAIFLTRHVSRRALHGLTMIIGRRAGAKLGMLLLCAGCVVIPTGKPFLWSDPELFKKERLAFLRVGSTTREEVTTRLGKPHELWNNETNILYWGVTETAVWLVPISCDGPGGIWTSVDLLFLEFDDKDRIKRYDLRKRSGPMLSRFISEERLRKVMDQFILEERSDWNSRSKARVSQ